MSGLPTLYSAPKGCKLYSSRLLSAFVGGMSLVWLLPAGVWTGDSQRCRPLFSRASMFMVSLAFSANRGTESCLIYSLNFSTGVVSQEYKVCSRVRG